MTHTFEIIETFIIGAFSACGTIGVVQPVDCVKVRI